MIHRGSFHALSHSYLGELVPRLISCLLASSDADLFIKEGVLSIVGLVRKRTSTAPLFGRSIS